MCNNVFCMSFGLEDVLLGVITDKYQNTNNIYLWIRCMCEVVVVREKCKSFNKRKN